MSHREASSFSYAVFSLTVDEARSQSVPIGVALWSPERQWVRFRLVCGAEKLKGVEKNRDMPVIDLVREQVAQWIETGQLPYLARPVPAYDDSWWRHARELLVHRVRLSEPRSIDCRDPEQELDVLYEAVVAAARPAKEQRSRIDGEITKCLKHLGDRFKTRQRIRGFGGRDVQVLRAFHGRRGWVVVEGINLATTQAEAQADATASKLMRLRETHSDDCTVIVGYLASPEGLNGEAVLVDWIRERTDAKVFDLMKDRSDFLTAADESVMRASGEQTLV